MADKCRVLCIDDHDDTSEMLKLILSAEDFDVQIASSFEEALALARAKGFDLYVLDRRLPDGSGLELCEKLMEITPGVPCIFYSGDAYEIHRSEAMAAGAHAYVCKPDIDELIQCVNNLLADKSCTTATG